mmetsp:Transcript_30123/g.70252  ORF Transcript_30123/g.70252 Transcript_30123/m.70252 type:complete len:261 (+) Transcript_30123:257-1039(+)|eukprot:CAMPEP_0178420044 /NCGR_PEP_ID=MMETSP0689_2-20121128/25926_1 /TAXON_ID=160604 /ORGANISM="Amphidinium massartii, Strain CS-259" /LENGTH=260 /DNA_ID=CAMNT_0020041507 /DNA_START=170 /DNA_END=952 /DNA_ORIENTATION=+
MLPWGAGDEGYAKACNAAARASTPGSATLPIAERFLGNRSLHAAATQQRPALLHLGTQPRSRSAARRKSEQENLAVEPKSMGRTASLFRQRRFATPISSARGNRPADAFQVGDDASPAQISREGAPDEFLPASGDAFVEAPNDERQVARNSGDAAASTATRTPSNVAAAAAAAPVAVQIVRFRDPREAALKLQRWWKKVLEERAEAFEVVVQELMAMREFAAVELQRLWRGYGGRKKCRMLRAQAREADAGHVAAAAARV